MAAQIVQNPGVQNWDTRTSALQNGDVHRSGDDRQNLRKRVGEPGIPLGASRNSEPTTAGWDQNPELLQWRANVLLDEMMLGAVDIAAGESTRPSSTPVQPTRNANYHTPEHSPKRRIATIEDESAVSHPTGYANGAHGDVHGDIHGEAEQSPVSTERGETSLHESREHWPQDEWSRPAWHFAEPTSAAPPPPQADRTPSARAVALQEHTRYQTMPTSSGGSSRYREQGASAPDIRTTAVGAPSARTGQPTAPKGAPPKNNEQWVLAAEQRYQQIAARHQAPAPEYSTHAAGVDAAVGAAGWIDPTDRLFADFAANGYDYGTGAGATSSSARGRQRTSQAMRRSNLLPRMSNLDPHALQQEMVMLQTELEEALPAGHESRERALRLLQKAYALLQTDPSRSAEVDYYLQQVRTMGQRVQETLHWSNLYRSRLTAYLVAWIVLSLIVLSGHYAYHSDLIAVLARLSGADINAEPLLPHNLLTALAAFFGGSLGGAVGALINMRQYGQIKQGFFDRKYSLRGLILPLIGGVVGLSLCFFFGVIYYLFALDPAVNLLFGALPTLVAFSFGITQEFIYGTRS